MIKTIMAVLLAASEGARLATKLPFLNSQAISQMRRAPGWMLWLFLFAMSSKSVPAIDCATLKSLSLPDTTITAADVVPEGPLKPSDANQQGAPTMPLHAHCRVAAVIAPTSDSHIEMEVWMPAHATDWNRKLQSVGNGGWGGFINSVAMAQALADGYATASSDTGHKGSRAEFALGHPEKL